MMQKRGSVQNWIPFLVLLPLVFVPYKLYSINDTFHLILVAALHHALMRQTPTCQEVRVFSLTGGIPCFPRNSFPSA